MRWSLALAQFVAVMVMWIGGAFGVSPINFCQCSKRSLCQPLPADHQFPVEVFIFDHEGMDWKHYDWTKVTTIVVDVVPPFPLLCYAHGQGVRVVIKENIQKSELTDSSQRKAWIRAQVHTAATNFLDGINLNFMDMLKNGSENLSELLNLLQETTESFHREIPGSQVSLDVPWSPHCIDGNCFQYVEISNLCDFFFVISFDIWTQKWDDCFAKPQSAYHKAYTGLSGYIDMGVDSKKLILGVSWYGSEYHCKRFIEPGRCEVAESPFRGGRCSYHVVHPIAYKEVMEQLPKSFTGRYWDDNYKVPFYVYKENAMYHEVWYEDPESLSLKSSIMRKLKLGGIGVWFGNNLNYSVNPMAAMQTEGMWNSLCPGIRKWRI
ncbi:di-N-acetylchitobiase-like [Scyliorhinus canicula]|uniref:di-N-acetylchitobiase-like n=1 Tax=Scyliorhinus canicula TaxID=7830 RepID=UPI0018F7BF50|nr:di-N-acetylchitobiase-like [Scyliorhinus canicula]